MAIRGMSNRLNDGGPPRFKKDNTVSIFDRDFSKIVPSAFMSGSLTQAVNVLEAALKEIELLNRDKAAWRPIETAPSNENVLLYCPYRGVANDARIELGHASSGYRVGQFSTVSHHAWATHWMPMPEPPADYDAPYCEICGEKHATSKGEECAMCDECFAVAAE